MIVTAVYIFIAWSVLDVFTFHSKLTVENNSLVAAATLSDRLATTLLIFGRYLLLLFYPHPLSFDYSYNQIPVVSFTTAGVIITLLVFIAWGCYAVLRFRKKDLYSFSFFYFMITDVCCLQLLYPDRGYAGRAVSPDPLPCVLHEFAIPGRHHHANWFPIGITEEDTANVLRHCSYPVLYSYKTNCKEIRTGKTTLPSLRQMFNRRPTACGHICPGVWIFPSYKIAWGSLEKQVYYEKAKKEFERSLGICIQQHPIMPLLT